MMNTVIKTSTSKEYLWLLMLSYTMFTAISNWFDARLISIFDFVLSPGTLVFPLTFLLSDVITEVYGYKNARCAIWTAFFFNLIFLAFGQLIIHMPSPSFTTDNAAFDKLLSLNARVVFASFLSYLISEPLNSYIIAKMKIINKGKFISFRFILSTFSSSGFDSSIFAIVAFSGIAGKNITAIIINIWIVKVIIECIGIPFSTRLSKWLKQREKTDIYDHSTNFTPIRLDTNYQSSDNHYQK